MRTEITTTVVLWMLAMANSAAAQSVPETEQSVEQSQSRETERRIESQNPEHSQPQEEELFSGPQVGEKLPPLPARASFDEAGKEHADYSDNRDRREIMEEEVHNEDLCNLYGIPHKEKFFAMVALPFSRLTGIVTERRGVRTFAVWRPIEY